MLRDPLKSFILTTFLFVVIVISGLVYFNKFMTVKRVKAQSAKPNIVLIVTDDQSAETVQAMPYVNGREDWVKFNNYFLNTPLCCPSRASILTGQYTHNHKVINNKAAKALNEADTLATWLKAVGYKTGLVGKYVNDWPNNRAMYTPPGWDYWVTFIGSPYYYNYKLYENGATITYGATEADYSTDVLAQKAQAFLQTTTSEEPFFLYFAAYAPHDPYTPALRHKGDYATTPMPRTPDFNEVDVSDKPNWVKSLTLMSVKNQKREDTRRRGAWELLLAYDDAIKGIFETLESKGVLENTVVIIAGDNGFSFGEHRLHNKRCAYEACLKSVLLVREPGVEGSDINELVSNVDIAPYIAELAEAAPLHTFNGRSLSPLIDGTSTEWRTEIFSEWNGDSTVVPGYSAVRTKDFKYIELKTGEKELYDLTSDPYELQNQISNPAYTGQISSLSTTLQQLKTQ